MEWLGERGPKASRVDTELTCEVINPDVLDQSDLRIAHPWMHRDERRPASIGVAPPVRHVRLCCPDLIAEPREPFVHGAVEVPYFLARGKATFYPCDYEQFRWRRAQDAKAIKAAR